MKRIFVLICLSIFAFTNLACTHAESIENNKKDTPELTKKIEVYYFHFTRRCKTCNAVEDITKETIRKYFSDKVKSGKITFKSVNLDEDAGKKVGEKLGVSGQTLLFISEGKQINLTNDAFMYAKTKPEKLKAKVKETIEELL